MGESDRAVSWLRPVFLFVVASPIGQLGCLTGALCTADTDCVEDHECTRTGECVPAGTAIRVVVRWTVNGQAPSPMRPEPCEPIGELEVVFHDGSLQPQNYRPVPCNFGRTVYDKMHVRPYTEGTPTVISEIGKFVFGGSVV